MREDLIKLERLDVKGKLFLRKTFFYPIVSDAFSYFCIVNHNTLIYTLKR